MTDAWTNDPPAAAPVAPPKAAWELDAPATLGPTTQQRAVVSANDNADEATKALNIGKKLGVAPTVVQSDLPGYSEHEKTQSAARASQNPALAKYINGNPMAASVSAGDWDAMEEASKTLQLLHPELFAKQVNGGVIRAVPEIAELSQTAAGRDKLFTALQALPRALTEGIVDFFQTPGKVSKGEINLNSPEGLDQAIGFGVGVALGSGRPRVGPAEPVPVSPAADIEGFLAKLRGMQTRAEIDAFLKSKEAGPPGSTLMITKAGSAADSLSKAVEAAQETKTRQQSPEMFEEAANAHDIGNVHIDGKKIVELYEKEGKTPAPGDGLFGFVPDIADKAQTAAAVGGEVTIPTGSYVAHVDPTVHEGLKESVRLHDDGVTLEEAKEVQKEIEAWHGTPHDFERFDLTKVGTGEGAQVYGHGLYFAEQRAVAEDYARTLGNKRGVYDMDPNSPTFGQFMSVSPGSLYKVSINADPTHFIDWDLPFSKQSEHVKEVIRKLAKTPAQLQAIEESALEMGPGMKLGHYPGTFDVQSPEFSKMYSEAGIPGIKYLDQGSRGALEKPFNVVDSKGESQAGFKTKAEAEAYRKELEDNIPGEKFSVEDRKTTRNWVVFDDRLVTIKEKNGNAVVAAVQEAVAQDKKSLYLHSIFEKAKDIDITTPEFKQYSQKLENAENEVLARAVKLFRSQITKTVTAEWKRNEAVVRTEVTDELTNSGRFAAERYLRENKIDIGHERVAEVADELAPLFGFDNGQDMLRGLESIDIEKAASGRGARVQLREAIKDETNRRMEAQYGRLQENISKEAMEIALADHTFDILADEVRILAKLNGSKPAFTKDEMVTWAKGKFEAMDVDNARDFKKATRAVARNGRDAEKALLKGDYAEALIAKQQQMMAATIAKESMKFNNLMDQVEAKVARFTNEQIIKGIDQEFLEQIREVLGSVGIPQVHAPYTEPLPLRDFTTASEGQLAVAPWLFETPPPVKDMKVNQFREFADSLKSMEHVGRWAKKLENAYGEAQLDNTVIDIVKSLQRFPFIDQPTHNPTTMQRVQSIGRKITAMHLLVERAFDYTDRFDPHGPITEWLDRPLRDANSKEIALTEETVRAMRELKQYVKPDLMEKIENNVIPDAMDKTGFMQMNRMNLRVLMLNMGNWSNIGKLSEGFGVNEADLRRLVARNATADDVAWVNGIWRIFKKLKPLADEVQVKDTGVSVDTIEAVPWEIGPGLNLDGGYYPMSYEAYNSDIQAQIARPLFDKGYFSAATPHGYTKERTEYSGAVDLSGLFLSSKLHGMIHDIAFRLPVRNANKLIENQQFRTAVGQYWGKEVADLLPGWIRDISNSHNIDDNYAQGIVRASALIRQNVVNTLIAYNPGTFIKHGFTAMVMSAQQTGLSALLGATSEIGITGALKNLKELAWKSDQPPDEAFMAAYRDMLDQGQRGDNSRQFVMDSSAVMRNRQRQYNESIRGAADEITNIGITQTLANFRQRQILYGRMAVAFSDQMSAMPTWLAAYKDAYAAGEAHEDAVFIADKAVSRAHGSSFIGDRAYITRQGNSFAGELARWGTQLMQFWNHQQNNQFQLAWDAAAMIRGPKAVAPPVWPPTPGAPPGGPPPLSPGGPPAVQGPGGGQYYEQEPGANATRIALGVAAIIGVIMIEELAGPAKDEHGDGLGMQMIKASARYFGGGWFLLRDVTNALAHGYEPSVGMMGTLFKGMSDVSKDLAKATGAKAGQAKNWIRNTMTAIGFATGVGGSQPGRTAQFAYDVMTGKDRPQGFNDYRQGMRTGHSKARKFK